MWNLKKQALRLYTFNVEPIYTILAYSATLSLVSFMVYSKMENMLVERTSNFFEIVSLGMAAMRLNGIKFLALSLIYSATAYLSQYFLAIIGLQISPEYSTTVIFLAATLTVMWVESKHLQVLDSIQEKLTSGTTNDNITQVLIMSFVALAMQIGYQLYLSSMLSSDAFIMLCKYPALVYGVFLGYLICQKMMDSKCFQLGNKLGLIALITIASILLEVFIAQFSTSLSMLNYFAFGSVVSGLATVETRRKYDLEHLYYYKLI